MKRFHVHLHVNDHTGRVLRPVQIVFFPLLLTRGPE